MAVDERSSRFSIHKREDRGVEARGFVPTPQCVRVTPLTNALCHRSE